MTNEEYYDSLSPDKWFGILHLPGLSKGTQEALAHEYLRSSRRKAERKAEAEKAEKSIHSLFALFRKGH